MDLHQFQRGNTISEELKDLREHLKLVKDFRSQFMAQKDRKTSDAPQMIFYSPRTSSIRIKENIMPLDTLTLIELYVGKIELEIDKLENEFDDL